MVNIKTVDFGDINPPSKSGKWKNTIRDFKEADIVIGEPELEDNEEKTVKAAYDGLRQQIKDTKRLTASKRNMDSENRKVYLVNLGKIKDMVLDTLTEEEIRNTVELESEEDYKQQINDLTGHSLSSLQSLYSKAQNK